MDKNTKEFVEKYVKVSRGARKLKNVLEVGSLDVNGEVRHIFDHVPVYHGVDIKEGKGVDFVGRFYSPEVQNKLDDTYDLILCLNILEHDYTWRETLISCCEKMSIGSVLLIVQPSRISTNNLYFANNRVEKLFLTGEWHEKGIIHKYVTEHPISSWHKPEKDYLSRFINSQSKHHCVNTSSQLNHNIHGISSYGDGYYSNVSLGDMLEILTFRGMINSLKIEHELDLSIGVFYNLKITKIC